MADLLFLLAGAVFVITGIRLHLAPPVVQPSKLAVPVSKKRRRRRVVVSDAIKVPAHLASFPGGTDEFAPRSGRRGG